MDRQKLSLLKATRKSDVSEVVIKRLISNFEKCVPAWNQKIDESFLSDEMKDKYKKLVNERMNRL